MAGERTEQATQHRREQARKEGDILHSRELSAAAGTLAGVMVLGALGTRVLISWRDTFAGFLDLGNPARWEPSTMAPTISAIRKLTIDILGPSAVVMAAVAAAALMAGVMQTGGVSFFAGAIGFKPDRINPITNVKNLFSLRAGARLAKSLIPASFLAVFAVQRIARQLTVPPFSLTRIEMLGTDIDRALGAGRAHAVDSRIVEISPAPNEDIAALLDRVESVEIEVYPRARVVVNERTGTVVIGGKVRLQPVSILHGGLSVNVISEVKVSQPNALSTGTTEVVQQTSVQAVDKPVNRIDLKEGATVEDLVQELQRTGAGARDVISILQAMKAAGALEADLEVL